MQARLPLLLLVLAVYSGAIGCSRERSRAIPEEERAATEGSRDYREMLVRTRTKVSAATVLNDLEDAVRRFQSELARLPTNLNELVTRRYLAGIPAPPPGSTYTYDPVQGNVGLAEIPDGSGIQIPAEVTNLTPVRLQEVPLPAGP